MAFKVKGVDVFSDNGALDTPTIKNLRNGLPADITDGDELAIYDSNSGIGPEGDIMRVTVDEFFNRDITTKSITSNTTVLQFDDLGVPNTSRETEVFFFQQSFNPSQAVNFGTVGLRDFDFNIFRIGSLDYTLLWNCADNSKGRVKGSCFWLGGTTGNDQLRNTAPDGSLYGNVQFISNDVVFGSLGSNTVRPYFLYDGSKLRFLMQNTNASITVNAKVTLTYDVIYYPFI